MVVEKDDLTRLTIAYMLESLKYSVIDVPTAEKALAILKGVQFDILVASLPLDDPDGKVFAWEAKAFQPQIKVVVTSGRLLEGELAPLIDGFVRKPFTMQQIDSTIKGVAATVRKA